MAKYSHIQQTQSACQRNRDGLAILLMCGGEGLFWGSVYCFVRSCPWLAMAVMALSFCVLFRSEQVLIEGAAYETEQADGAGEGEGAGGRSEENL